MNGIEMSNSDWPNAARGEKPWRPPGAVRVVEETGRRLEFSVGDVYEVLVRYLPWGVFSRRIQISRVDGTSLRDWRDEQWIKDQVAGADAVAVEFYPRRCDVNDPSNATYLWVLRDPDVLPSPFSPSAKVWTSQVALAPQRGFKAGALAAFVGGEGG